MITRRCNPGSYCDSAFGPTLPKEEIEFRVDKGWDKPLEIRTATNTYCLTKAQALALAHDILRVLMESSTEIKSKLAPGECQRTET